tara:strand:- start:4092 stop:4520 length:429 start_codon:yes stop_codon:yes gene_type:complete
MTLVNTRAAFEKAVTDAVIAVDNTVEMVYDNMVYKTPGKTKKYIVVSLDFSQATTQTQGAAQDFYSGVVLCNIYVPKGKGTATLSTLGEAVIDGLTSVNASNYNDTFNCSPRVADVSGPVPIDVDDSSHFLGLISCQFTANA